MNLIVQAIGTARAAVARVIARVMPLHPGEEGVRIVPDAGTASRPLTAVMAVMCFLACLALGSLFIINRSVAAWTSDVGRQITVQIKPVANADTDAEVAKAVKILKASPGILSATALTKAENARLLEPWLGAGAALGELPVPRLIAVEVDSASPPNLAGLTAQLERAVPGAVLDSHKRWQRQILRTTGTMKLLGYAVLFLVCGTTVAIVVFATRAAMASNRNTIDVLHLIGAQDSFIAHEVQRHFLAIGLKAGFTGALAGIASFIVIKAVSAGPGESADAVATHMLIGTATLGIGDYFVFLLIPVGTALISVVTARLAALRLLGHVL